MQAAVILNIAVLANFNTIYVAAHGHIKPAAAVFLHRYFANNGGRLKHMGLGINLGHLTFKISYHKQTPLSQAYIKYI
jgi:hypothetical protein